MMIDLVGGHRTAQSELPVGFVSDVHLGSRYCQAEKFLLFLHTHEFGELYLVGDFIDGWRLQRKWRWPEVYHRIFRRLLQMHASGTRLYYTPGNHDEFLRRYLQDFGFVNVADEFCYHAVNGQRFLITHGDKFDGVEKSIPWLSRIGASVYEVLMWLNYSVNRIRKLLSLDEYRFSSQLKHRCKRAVKFINDFEQTLADYARTKNCDGVICGHIHAPSMQQFDDVSYFNTGDWVEHCTALIEHQDGTWEVKDYLTEAQAHSEESSNGEDLLQHVGRGPRPRGSGSGDRRQLAESA